MIELRGVTITAGRRTLLADISASLPAGNLCAFVGRNGTGKSTLLRCICGLQRPDSGDIMLNGHSLSDLSPRTLATTISCVSTGRIRIPSLSCRDVVAMGRAPYTNWIGHMQAADKAIVDQALATVGMSHLALRSISTLSDGECQRVMVARAIAQTTPVILLDEPTSFLDMPGRYELAELLRDLTRNQGKTILFSTHELDIASRIADTVWVIDDRQLLSLPASDFVSQGHANRIFGINL